MENNYWDRKASGYDDHMKKSMKAYEQLIELIKNEIDKSCVLLDIGTGTGAIPIALADCVDKIYATDYSQEMIGVATNKANDLNIQNIIFQVQDCYNLSFNENMFDVIVASNILHLLDKPEQFLFSIRRLLKKNGKLIVPTFLHNESLITNIISRILKLSGHPISTRFNSKSMIELITKCGYSIDKQVLLPSIMPMLFVTATN
jgi:ubiquinone/menaquinone biosynthesis C-methylase UbiE